MSIATEINRIQTARNTIRTKLVELGLAVSTATLDACADAIEDIINQGAVNAQVTEGSSYTIPAGYHNGSGVVAGIAGGGNYSLQEKTVTPTKKTQSITSDSGYYGLSGVTVNPIPTAYQDVSTTTAAAGNVLTGKVFVLADGTVTTGTMANNGAVTKTLSTASVSYTIAAGYHSGTGKVSITLEEKSVTPTKSAQTVTPTSGKVLSKVTVGAIPAEYQDVSGVTADEYAVLAGSSIVKSDGTLVEGKIVNKTFDGYTPLHEGYTKYTIPEGYYEGGVCGAYINMQDIITFTPAKRGYDYTIKADAGKVLKGVTVKDIPDAYQDVTGVTATAANVLDGKYIVTSDGTVTEGTMANNGAISETIDGLTSASVTIPAGYTSGGTVSLTSAIETALAAI